MNKRILTVLIIIFTALLSGCVGKEPNEIAYIVALGLDKTDNNNYEMTIQYANTTAISGGASEEGGKAGNEIVEQITVEAPNIYAGIGLANHLVSKTFSMSHAKIMVFSNEVAEEGLNDIMETFARSDELRPDITLVVARESANEYLTSVTPQMEINPAQYYQLLYQKNNLVGIPKGIARDFFFAIQTNDKDGILPVAGVIKSSQEDSGEQSGGQGSQGKQSEESSKEEEKEEEKNNKNEMKNQQKNVGGDESGSQSEEDSEQSGSGESSQNSEGENEEQQEAPINEEEFEYKMKDYLGGDASLQKKNKSEAVGAAVFKGDKKVGFLGSLETEMIKILTGNYKASYITFYNKQTPQIPITVKALSDKKPKYDIDIKNKKIDIKVSMECDLYALPSEYNVENDIESFEKESSQYMDTAMTKFVNDFINEYDCDILGFKERAKSKFFTNKEYEEFKETVNFKEYNINVKTNFRVRRTGLIIKDE